MVYWDVIKAFDTVPYQKLLDSGAHVDVVYYDFIKTFDKYLINNS